MSGLEFVINTGERTSADSSFTTLVVRWRSARTKLFQNAAVGFTIKETQDPAPELARGFRSLADAIERRHNESTG